MSDKKQEEEERRLKRGYGIERSKVSDQVV